LPAADEGRAVDNNGAGEGVPSRSWGEDTTVPSAGGRQVIRAEVVFDRTELPGPTDPDLTGDQSCSKVI
jgi:hypothetical protein